MERSERILQGLGNQYYRATLKSMGFTTEDLKRPVIGIANAWSECVPGHYNLRQVAQRVKDGIYRAGGTPIEFGVIGGCDGMGQGHDGMHYILPSRELIANSIESMAQINLFDGLVLLGSCDKIVPGMLMAAARLDIPCIFLPGGPMEGGVEFDGRQADQTSSTEAYGMLSAGKITEAEYVALEDTACPGCGSCSYLGTANTMCALAEALGMTLPDGGLAPAPTAVALAVFLHADLCQIYTDVDGVYDKDPRLYPDAMKFDWISYEKMRRLIAGGAQVLHDRSVELAQRFGLAIEVLSSFTGQPGTIVCAEESGT